MEQSLSEKQQLETEIGNNTNVLVNPDVSQTEFGINHNVQNPTLTNDENTDFGNIQSTSITTSETKTNFGEMEKPLTETQQLETEVGDNTNIDSNHYVENQTENFSNNEQIESLSHSISSCLLYTSPSPRDRTRSRMPSSA